MVLLNELRSCVKMTSVLIVLVYLVSTSSKKLKFKHGPSGMSFHDSTNCTEFSKFGRFNPYSVLNEKWFVFYYWDRPRSLTTFIFTVPSANHTRRLRKLLDGNSVLPVMWDARQVLMEDNDGYISLLVERSDRGEYWLYPVARVRPGQKLTPRDVRLKQTSDNRVLGLMDCAEDTLLVMSKLNDVPRQGDLHAAASRLGYRGRNGKSYLYQGHEWGPIGEADEDMFWDRRERKDSKDTSKEDKSSEENNEDVEFLPINTQEKKKGKTNTNKAKTSKAFSPPIKEDDEKCYKVVPELWNDPKPEPETDNLRITKKELDANNSLLIEAQDELPNKTEERNFSTESDNKQEDHVTNNQNEVIESVKPLADQKQLESHTKHTDPEDESCVVCYKSQLNYMPAYIPDRTDTFIYFDNKEEKAAVEVPLGEIPHYEVPFTKLSHADVNSDESPRAEIPGTEVSGTEVPLSEVPQTEAPEISESEIITAKVPRAEIPGLKVPQIKIHLEKTVSDKKTTTEGPIQPPQDLTNSSEIIILTPKTLDDLKS